MNFKAVHLRRQKTIECKRMIMDIGSGNTAQRSSGPIEVDLQQVIYALSEALDLVGIDDVAHGKRVGIMAADCGHVMGYPADEVRHLFDLGMVHDIGVSSTATHQHLIREFDWEGSQAHCNLGHDRLQTFLPLAHLAGPITYHHTRWDRLAHRADIPPKDAEYANLIYLVDRVDALIAPYYANGAHLVHIPTIRQKIGELTGRYFAPHLVDAFLAASAVESFWLQLEPHCIQDRLGSLLANEQTCQASIDDLLQLATLFASIVDAKSPYTANHSLGVARLSRLLAERLGVPADVCDKLQIAGLLHDLGKLRVPDEILDKPVALDERERDIINTHSFETFRILHHIHGFAEIAPWAAYHHEQPDGSGYPFHLHADMLCLESRIIRVADIFQAMSQDRPYRQGSSATSVLIYLRKLAARRSVDGRIVEVAARDLRGVLEAACIAA